MLFSEYRESIGHFYRLARVSQGSSGGACVVCSMAMRRGVAPSLGMCRAPWGGHSAIGLRLASRAGPAHEPFARGCQFYAKAHPLLGMPIRVHLLLLDGHCIAAQWTNPIRRTGRGCRRGRNGSWDKSIPCEFHRVRIGVVQRGEHVIH